MIFHGNHQAARRQLQDNGFVRLRPERQTDTPSPDMDTRTGHDQAPDAKGTRPAGRVVRGEVPQRSGAGRQYQVCGLCGKVVRGLCRKAAAAAHRRQLSRNAPPHQCGAGSYAHGQIAAASYHFVL